MKRHWCLGLTILSGTPETSASAQEKPARASSPAEHVAKARQFG